MLNHLAGMKQVKKIVYVCQNKIFILTKMGYFRLVSILLNDATKSSIDRDLHSTFASLSSTGNTKGGSITVPLTSCLTGLESAV